MGNGGEQDASIDAAPLDAMRLPDNAARRPAWVEQRRGDEPAAGPLCAGVRMGRRAARGVERGKSAVRLYNGYADRAARHAQHDAAAVDRRCGRLFRHGADREPLAAEYGQRAGCDISGGPHPGNEPGAFALCARLAGMPAADRGARLAALARADDRARPVRLPAVAELLRGPTAASGEPDGGRRGTVGLFPFPPLLAADRGAVFPKLHRDRGHRLDGYLFQGYRHPVRHGRAAHGHSHLGRNAGRAAGDRVGAAYPQRLPCADPDDRLLHRRVPASAAGGNGGLRAGAAVCVRHLDRGRQPDRGCERG